MQRTALIAISLAFAAPATAQDVNLEVSPYVGLLIPLSQIGDGEERQVPIDDSSIVIVPGFSAKHDVGVAIGVRLAGWLGDHWGLQIEGSYSPSKLEGTNAFIATGSVRVLYQTAPRTRDRKATIAIGAGPALIWRGGDAYEDIADEGVIHFPNRTDIGGVVGVALRTAPKTLGLTLTLEDYLYTTELAFLDPPFEQRESHFQSDLVLSLGVDLQI